MSTPDLGIVADDLSGAAECAAHALMRVSRSAVLLARGGDAPTDAGASPEGPAVLTVDTDSRRLAEADAVRAVRAAAALVAGTPVVVKKVDSLLRGHVAAEVIALAEALRRTPVVAVANPALGRVVVDGVLHVGGTPLHRTDLWAVEGAPAPDRVATALHPLPTVTVPHPTVLQGVGAVTAALVDAARAGLVAVCDAVTDDDLAVVHAAALAASAQQGRDPLLVGSGALADTAVRALPSPPRRSHRAEPAGPPARSVLVVLGTRAPGVAAQIAQLGPTAAETLLLDPDRLLRGDPLVADRIAGLPRRGVVVVGLDPAADADPTRSRALTEALAATVSPLLDHYDAAFLSGGETARAVLDRLDVRALDVVAEIGTGTVVSRRPGGRVVVTRPGSFGDPTSLVRVVDHLRGTARPSTTGASHSTPGTIGPPPSDHPSATAPRATPGATTEENS